MSRSCVHLAFLVSALGGHADWFDRQHTPCPLSRPSHPVGRRNASRYFLSLGQRSMSPSFNVCVSCPEARILHEWNSTARRPPRGLQVREHTVDSRNSPLLPTNEPLQPRERSVEPSGAEQSTACGDVNPVRLQRLCTIGSVNADRLDIVIFLEHRLSFTDLVLARDRIGTCCSIAAPRRTINHVSTDPSGTYC